MTKYRNRYGDEYKFELMPNGNIMWTGKFEWCRWGMPNVYDKAYVKYQEDGGTESLKKTLAKTKCGKIFKGNSNIPLFCCF